MGREEYIIVRCVDSSISLRKRWGETSDDPILAGFWLIGGKLACRPDESGYNDTIY